MNMSHHFFSRLQQAMRRRLFRGNSRGIAAVEFALITPILVVLLVIIVDAGLFVYQRTVIIGAVSAGAQFAVLAAQQGTTIDTAFSTNARSATLTQSQGQLTAAGASVTVTLHGTSSTNVCCITTSGRTTWPTPPCSDGSPPGIYITIVGSAPFTPLLSADTYLVGSVMNSTLIERLE
jgi:Flp pilus assembly protein TadG